MQQRRRFTWLDQETFARISCDYNPIHVDAVAARRTPVGAPIVHGVHSLLWLLECVAESAVDLTTSRRLKAKFLRPIYVDEEVAAEVASPEPGILAARIIAGTEAVVVVHLSAESAKPLPAANPHAPRAPSTPCIAPPARPEEPDLESMRRQSGCLSFGPDMGELNKLFPSATRAFGQSCLASLACSSCLVGMVIPGLHSLYSGLEVTFSEDTAAPQAATEYSVSSVVERFRSVQLSIRSQGLHGVVEAINRAPPVKQPGAASVRGRVDSREFLHGSSLVVGGSRGLGELAAKLLAAGGNTVTITYANGKADAEAVAAEIKESGGHCTTLCYDVTRPAAEQLRAISTPPNHVYYFPTPAIARRKSGLFDSHRLAELNAFYLTAFSDLVQACAPLRPDGIKIFYPSSVFVETRPTGMTEYAMAKAAGEVLCNDLSKWVPGVQVLTRRLPRMLTDQTSGVAQAQLSDSIEVLLSVIRAMHGVNGA